MIIFDEHIWQMLKHTVFLFFNLEQNLFLNDGPEIVFTQLHPL